MGVTLSYYQSREEDYMVAKRYRKAVCGHFFRAEVQMIHLATVPLFCSTTCRKPNCSVQVKKNVLPSQKTVNLEGIQLNMREGWKLPDKK